MIEQMAMKDLLLSGKAGIGERKKRIPVPVFSAWRIVLVRLVYTAMLCAVTLLVYLAMGIWAQRLDPTVGWLDHGMLSLPLYAAGCCICGAGLAGLLPVVVRIIGRKGGVEKWKETNERTWSLLGFVAYTVLLYALL